MTLEIVGLVLMALVTGMVIGRFLRWGGETGRMIEKSPREE